MAQALHMGDEVHNRNVAATSPAPQAPGAGAARHRRAARPTCAAVLEFVAGNDHFFLNLSMAACKAMLDAAHGVRRQQHGDRDGAQRRRLRHPAERHRRALVHRRRRQSVDGLYFPGYGIEDAAADLGDSAITETAGLGGFAMAAAPAIVQFVGGTPHDAIANTLAMAHITLGAQPGVHAARARTSPARRPASTRARCVDTGILPVINTGIAHREAGVGQIGAGVTHAPLACFTQALAALAEHDGRRGPEPAGPPESSRGSCARRK